METVQITKEAAIKAFDNADSPGRKLLGYLFGEKVFQREITDRVKTFDDALKIVGASENQNILIQYNGTDKDMLAAQALLKLTIIGKALNEGWTPDWTNSSQYKYCPYFRFAVSGFSFDGCDYAYTYASVGSRLVFKTEALGTYAGKQFIDLYNQLFIL